MIFTRPGFKALKFAYLVLFAGLGVAGFIVAGSYVYWQTEKKNDQQSQRALLDLRGRLATAVRDREDLRGSEDTYKALVARGTFLTEERFDLIEALAALKTRHKLAMLTYEVAPQRPLRLSTGATYSGVNLVASRVKFRVRTLHDADLVGFLDEFPRLQRGFFPLDHCAIKRTIETQPALTPGTAPPDEDGTQTVTSLIRPGGTPTARTTVLAAPIASLDAECSLDWITLQPKGGNTATTAGQSPPTGARAL